MHPAVAVEPARPDPPATQVWVDFRPDPSLPREVADALAPLHGADAGVLVGDHVDDPTPHSPADVAEAIQPHGLPAIVTLTCRARTVATLTELIDRLRAAGVAAVHCVTGDHPAARLGLEVDPSFVLDGTRLAALAASSGPVSVAESPASPPAAWRPTRLLAKQRAGAGLAILNHCGDVGDLVDFAQRCRAGGVEIPLVAPVPVVTDRRSAESLARFPGLTLPPGLTDAILTSPSPRRTGVQYAVDMAQRLLASGLFAGVNLSGSGADTGLVARSELMAEIVQEIR